MTGQRTPALRRLGRTDIHVSAVAMGCWAIVGDATWGQQDEHDALAALRQAYEAGINFFDTAEMYGSGYSEELIARALGDVRDRIVIGSKVSPEHATSWEAVRQACEASLQRLGTDVIDVYHLHWPVRDRPVADVLAHFERLQREGKIRCFAVSNFGRQDLTDLLAAGRCEVNQLPYNLLWRVIEAEVLPICREHDVSVTCYSPLAQALLTGKFESADDVPPGRARTRHFASSRSQTRHGEAGAEEETFSAVAAVREIAADLGRPMAEVALAWLMQQPGIASVIVGIRNPGQVQENAQAMDLRLSDDTLQRLSDATAPLKSRFGLNPDMWQSASRYR